MKAELRAVLASAPSPCSTATKANSIRHRTPHLPESVERDSDAATYVALWKHNAGKAQRAMCVERMKGITIDSLNKIEIEEQVLHEESNRLRILTSIAHTLRAEFERREKEQIEMCIAIESYKDSLNNAAINSINTKRESEVEELRREIEWKRSRLAACHAELNGIKSDIQRVEVRLAPRREGETQSSKSATTLSEYLGLPTATKPVQRMAVVSSNEQSRDEWLNLLRKNRGDNMQEVFQESHASPLTMLLSPKTNIGHRRDEVRRTVDTIAHLSPIRGNQESFSGADVEAVYDTSKISGTNSALELRIQNLQQQRQQHMFVARDAERLRMLDAFERYDDPRGTIAYVATTDIDMLRKDYQQLMHVFNGAR